MDANKLTFKIGILIRSDKKMRSKSQNLAADPLLKPLDKAVTMIYNYFENEKKLLYYEHGAEEIPDEVIAEFSQKDVTNIDFSSNSLASLNCISHFCCLKEVIFDNNFLTDTSEFPRKKFPDIVVLSLNNNKFSDLNRLLLNLCWCFPNIRYLSLLGNPLCPAMLQNYSDADYRAYRLSIISKLTKLKFLDARRVDKSERLSVVQLQKKRSSSSLTSSTSQPTPERVSRMERFGSLKRFFGFAKKQSTPPPVEPVEEIREVYSPLPSDDFDNTSQKSYYGKIKNHYEGANSQGNRFILNQDL